MNRVIALGVKAREELAKGADFLADAVGSTLGPFGSNFFLDKKNSITNDGVTVAREVQLQDEIQNRGASALREAAVKTNDEAGDGTTTATVLAQAIFHSASRFLGKENVIGRKKPIDIINKIEKERKEVTEKLIASAKTIETKQQLIDSAVVSVGDKELGTLIGEAQWKLGKDGILLVEETNDKTSSIEEIRGVRIDNGFGTSQVINNIEKQTLEVEDAAILLTTYSIKDVREWNVLMKLFEPAFKSGIRELVVIARAWTDLTINFCLQNINKGSFKIYPISAPYIDMTEKMKDLAAVTGATFYDSEGYTLEDIMVSGLGRIEKVRAGRMDAIITGKKEDATNTRVNERVEQLKKKLQGSPSEFEKKQLSERIAQLQNGFAIVKVGSTSDMERQRLIDKCEDAVNAVRAAFQEGTVKGGGLAMKEIADTLPDDYILKRPLMTPYEQIMASAPEGFVIEEWVRNPVKVERIALRNACTAAATFATTGGVITAETPKPFDTFLRKALSQTSNE